VLGVDGAFLAAVAAALFVLFHDLLIAQSWANTLPDDTRQRDRTCATKTTKTIRTGFMDIPENIFLFILSTTVYHLNLKGQYILAAGLRFLVTLFLEMTFPDRESPTP
jgi:hypothetical protein